jgi:Contractile injection system tube protein
MAKFTICGYSSDPTGSGASAGGDVLFTTNINPEKFTHTTPIKYNDGNHANNGTRPIQQQGFDPQEMMFEFLFDGTGAAGPDSTEQDVPGKVKALYDVAYKYQGDLHKTKWLKIVWTKFSLVCHLKEINIDYELFNNQGEAIRVKATLTFIEHVKPATSARARNNSSPDLSHIKVVRLGDSLTHLCKSVYNTPDYYTQIAGINKLTNFRKMTTGNDLLFPPIEK